MFKSKYSTVLTIILIVVITGIVVVAGIIGAKVLKNYREEKNREKQIAEFEEEIKNNNEEEKQEDVEEEGDISFDPIGENNQGENNGGNSSNRVKTKLYDKKYPMAGYIEIEKTKAKYPILLDTSPAALEVGVGVIYPSNPRLNEPGNTVIIGHNYRNGKLFSNNKKLVVGDKVKVTDLNGRTVSYTIYEIFEVPENNTEYISRDRGGNTEISLSTCTDDGKARLIILARAE